MAGLEEPVRDRFRGVISVCGSAQVVVVVVVQVSAAMGGEFYG